MGTKKNNSTAMPRMAVRIIVAPVAFFGKMPKKGGFLEPLIFAGVAGFAASIIHAIWSFLGFGYGGQAQSGWAWILLSIIFIPVILAIFSFIGAAILFLIWKLMGSKQNYETSYLCMAYLMALAPLIATIEIIPYAGMILTLAIVTFYIIVVSKQVHGISVLKALAVFVIIGLSLTMLSLNSEYSERNPTPDQVRKAAEETAKQYHQNIDEIRKQAELNRYTK
jgi:hypothetical protein